ncbi:Epsin-3, clathrin recruitment and traffic between the Golgi and endosome [Coemansia biformis]|uniref:Epsin-3, clathrin recruitment and traffic between the Golgi and endosome n=1 Tax=Coemansia biformis TaxID=1286918 RepID=A0A9W7YDK1_9FUNG|nr:Epsin-3, clathrin recruitment and traffic between the Golgi and endosome [Coemansia biformis]
MDLNKLTDISVWDVRNVYNKVKNVVMNYSEMEIKVIEATGPEPWGASSTVLRELADATNNRKDFDDIMAMVYVRLSDTDPASWRQVYKALQLVEYLIKNGSSRVVDDVRGHIIIKTLKSFHYIDAAGKDQGINVRHRSKEILDLVNDRDRLREERSKASDNRDKYGGFAGGSRMDGFGSTSSAGRGSAGFGNTGRSNSSSGGGGALGSKFSGLSSSDYMASRYDDRVDGSHRSESDSTPSTTTTTTRLGSRKSTRQITPVGAKAQEPEVADLFSFDDSDDVGGGNGAFAGSSTAGRPAATAPAAGNLMDSLDLLAPAPAAASQPAATPGPSAAADDDWGDFQSAGPGVAPQSTANARAFVPAPMAPPATTSGAGATPVDLLGGDSSGMSFQPLATSPRAGQAPAAPSLPGAAAPVAGGSAKKAAPFSDIWDMGSDLLSLDSLSLANKAGGANAGRRPQNASMNQLSSQHRPAC